MKLESTATCRTTDILTRYEDWLLRVLKYLEGSKIQKQHANRGCGISTLQDTENLTRHPEVLSSCPSTILFYNSTSMTHHKESCRVMSGDHISLTSSTSQTDGMSPLLQTCSTLIFK